MYRRRGGRLKEGRFAFVSPGCTRGLSEAAEQRGGNRDADRERTLIGCKISLQCYDSFDSWW